jgi:ornithine cyclodeaminase/alanine dehydrogenase-like protein (mu-crystallin family)
METLILGADEIRGIALRVGIDALMDEAIERLTRALETFDGATTTVPARRGFVYDRPAPGLLEWMPCMEHGRGATIKIVGYHPGNARADRLPTIVSTVSAYDTGTGHLRCLMDGTFLTALRTGAASAVASRILASARSRTLGLVGAGAQAVTQLHALARVFDLDRVLVYDIDVGAQASFASRAGHLAGGARVEPAPLRRIIETSDLICTATSVGVGDGPVFAGWEPRPWAHFNAVGSDFPGKVELPVEVLRHCFVCPDSREQAVREGECQQLEESAIGPQLYELVQRRSEFLPLREVLTVFDSTGWALEDRVAMELLMDHAEEIGVGRVVGIETTSGDVLNPYDFLTSDPLLMATARSTVRVAL